MMRIIRNVLPLLVAILLIFFFIKDVDWSEVAGAVKKVPVIYIAGFLFGILLQYAAKAYRWGIILKPQRANISFGVLFHFTSLSFFLNTITGRLGEPAKGILIARHYGFAEGAGLASVVVERLLDFLIMIILFLFSFLLFPMPQNPLLEKMRLIAWLAMPLILLVFLVFFLINRKGLSPLVRSWLEKVSRIMPLRYRQRFFVALVSFAENLHINLPTSDFYRLIISSCIVWLGVIPIYWILMCGFDFGRPIGLLETFPYFALIMAAAAIPTPGMAGSLDSASKIGFFQLLGVSSQYGGSVIAFTLFFHTILLVLALITGLVAINRLKIGSGIIKGVKNREMPRL